jgi:hypothetical protein
MNDNGADTTRSIPEQIRANLVAIISLLVAVSSLSYNTWRNELTEENRNVRHAGFEVLLKLGELQQVVFFSHYDMDQLRGSPRAGWAYVLVINDLSQAMPAIVSQQATILRQVWDAEWPGLGEHDSSAERISTAIDTLRMTVLDELRKLD